MATDDNNSSSFHLPKNPITCLPSITTSSHSTSGIQKPNLQHSETTHLDSRIWKILSHSNAVGTRIIRQGAQREMRITSQTSRILNPTSKLCSSSILSRMKFGALQCLTHPLRCTDLRIHFSSAITRQLAPKCEMPKLHKLHLVHPRLMMHGENWCLEFVEEMVWRIHVRCAPLLSVGKEDESKPVIWKATNGESPLHTRCHWLKPSPCDWRLGDRRRSF